MICTEHFVNPEDGICYPSAGMLYHIMSSTRPSPVAPFNPISILLHSLIIFPHSSSNAFRPP